MNIAIIGSRNLSLTSQEIYNYFLQLNIPLTNITILSGGAKGIDTSAESFAHDYNIPITIYYPDYNKYGKSATFIRNDIIINNANIVLAFWDGQSKGTLYSINKAKKLNKKLHVINL